MDGKEPWLSIRSLQDIMAWVPRDPSDTSRLAKCVEMVRQRTETDQFPEISKGERLSELRNADELIAIEYPKQEINRAIRHVRPFLVALIPELNIDRVMKQRLIGEIGRDSDFLEEDDRGTIGGFIEPSGLTMEKMRNNSRLDALAELLRQLAVNPTVVLHYVERSLTGARASLDGWEFDPQQGIIKHKGEVYSDLSSESTLFLKMIVEADGEYVSFNSLGERAAQEKIEISSLRIKQVRSNLPKPLQKLLQSARGLGTRLKK